MEFSVWNTVGQKVWRKRERLISGTSEWVLPVTDFPKGVYIIQAEVNGQTYHEKVIIR